MTKQARWRKIAVWTAIDAILVFSAGSAMAAPAAGGSMTSPHIPALLMLGVGMVTAGRLSRH